MFIDFKTTVGQVYIHLSRISLIREPAHGELWVMVDGEHFPLQFKNNEEAQEAFGALLETLAGLCD